MPTAMVIDDSRAMRMILRRTLQRLGFETWEAGNGREALDRIAAGNPPVSLFLVDWNMPVMNGLEFVRNVRQIAAYRSSRLMMVTTETEICQIETALQAGANEYVTKPFTDEIIEDKLRMIGAIS